MCLSVIIYDQAHICPFINEKPNCRSEYKLLSNVTVSSGIIGTLIQDWLKKKFNNNFDMAFWLKKLTQLHFIL